jgi:hypothetical protein
VPDNQEVFADADTDQSVIVELVEPSENSVGPGGAEHYLRSILEEDGVTEVDIVRRGSLDAALDLRRLPDGGDGASFVVASYRHFRYKEGREAANTVRVYLAVVHLTSVASDVLITFNAPTAFAATSISAGRTLLPIDDSERVFHHLLRSFRVLSFAIFPGGADLEASQNLQ